MAKRRQLLVIVDPTARSHPSIERAAWLAKHLPARIELCICEYDTHLAESRVFDAAALTKARASLVETHRRRLDALATPLTAAGLEVTVDARWDHPLHDAIVRKTIESGATLVIKDTHYHSVLKRSVFSNTDWNLIRNCPAELWLVKPRAIGQPPRFVAAIDPVHEHDKPAELDRRIVNTAETLARATGGELHVFHAFDIAPVLAVSTDALTMPISLPIRELAEAMEKAHTTAVHELTDARKLPRDRVHIHQGGTRELLTAFTEQLHADAVVMGAISRSGLQRLFIGSTAEEVLDKLGCDLLIVKPAGFEAALPG